MTKAVLIGAVLVCAVALFLPWRLPTARSAKRATPAVSNSPPEQVHALPPTFATLPFPKPKPTLHPRTVTPVPAGVPGQWALKFDAEFTGTSLDTSQWSTGWYGSGITAPANEEENDCYDPAQVSEGGGALSLSLTQKSENCGSPEPYAAGLVSTMGKFSFTYGFIQARVWLPAVPGHPGEVANWPGVWADGQNWPDDGEIDIAEGIAGQVCAHFHDAASPQGIGAGGGSGCPTGTYAGGWHTFAADWEPGSITYYYDGADIGTVTSGITSAPMFLVLDYAVLSPAYAPATMKVAYVRVWQHP
jgi:beta-glucanase (GH16 family)